MVLKEASVRGYVGRALREAVRLARLMEATEHVSVTRQKIINYICGIVASQFIDK